MKFNDPIGFGKVEGAYISVHPVGYSGADYFRTRPVDELVFDLAGIAGDRHYGFTATSGGRLKPIHPKGSGVRNNRMWLATSPEELAQTSRDMGLETALTSETVGANLLIAGVGPISQLASMTYFVCSPHSEPFQPGNPREEDVVLVAYADAIPCGIAGKGISSMLGAELTAAYVRASNGRRGLTGWVERGGIVRPGYTVTLLHPTGRD